MYVISGATGNTGKPLAMALLDAGKKVRIISRSPEKAKELTIKGAELYTGSTNDREFLTKALHGAEAVYVMIPLDWQAADYTAHQVAHAEAFAHAIEKNKVPYAVTLSSIGAHLGSGSGVVLGLHHMEVMLNHIQGLNVLHLRPTYFMENTLGQAALVKAAGIMGSPVRGDMKMPMIATKDIAAYASGRLLKLDFSGHSVQYLLGSRDVNYHEVAAVYGKAIGKPGLPYVEFSYEDFKNSMMTQMGVSENVADNMNEFIKAANEGRVVEDTKRDAGSTTPTTIEEFAGVFAHVYSTI